MVRPVPDAAVGWSTPDSSTVSVRADGLVTARQSGSARVIVVAGDRADTVHITVLAPLTATDLAVALDTLTAIGRRSRIAVTSRSQSGDRAGAYSVVSRDPSTVNATLADESLIDVVAVKPGSAWVVVTERGGTADSALIVVSPRVAHIVLAERFTSYPGDSVLLTPTLLDAEGRAVPSGAVAWESEDTAIASVSQTGLVRFNAVGAAFIKARSDSAVAFVRIVATNTLLPWISFDRDSVSLGAGLVFPQVMVNHSRLPAGAPLTIASLDPSVAEVAVSNRYSDQTDVRIIGHRTGVTRLIATAGSVRPDTLLVRVSTSRLDLGRGLTDDSPSYEIALESEPAFFGVIIRDSSGAALARANPVAVTLTSSDPGILRVADGQTTIALQPGGAYAASNVIPVAPGRVTLRATAPGFLPDSVTVTIGARPRLYFLPNKVVTVAVGHETATNRRSIGTTGGPPRTSELVVTLTQRNPAVVGIPATVTLATNSIWRNVTFTGRSLGTDTVIATAPGFDPDTTVIIVTRPKLVVDPPSHPMFTNGVGAWMWVTDSLGHADPMLESRVFAVTSSNTDVLRPAPYFEFGPNQPPAGRNFGAVDSGFATITITETSGLIAPVSLPLHVRGDTTLAVFNQLDEQPFSIGLGQQFREGAFVLLRGRLFFPQVTVYLRSTDPSVLRVPDSLVLREDAMGTHLPVTVGDTPGRASIIATARGFRAASTGLIEVGRSKLDLVAPESLFVGGGADGRLLMRDPRGVERANSRDVHVRLTPLDGGLLVPDTAVVVAAGASRSALIPIRATAPGMLRLEASDTRSTVDRFASDTVVIRALLPTLSFTNPGPLLVGIGQRTSTAITRPTWSQPVVVGVRSSRNRTTSASTVTLPAGTIRTDYAIAGRAIGSDTLTLSAPSYVGHSVRVIVTEGHTRLTRTPPEAVLLGESFAVRFAVGDSAGVPHPLDAPVTFQLAGTGVTFSNGRSAITSVTVPAGAAESDEFLVVGSAAGQAAVEVRHLDYRTLRFELRVLR